MAKLLVFISPILLLFLLKGLLSQPARPLFTNQTEEQHATYFIGSSRVKSGLDPAIILDCEHRGNAFCLGINNSTFSHNLHVAKHFLLSNGSKHVFIEISPSKRDLPVSVVKAHALIGSGITGLALAASEGAGMQEQLGIWEAYLAYRFSRLNLRELFRPPVPTSEFSYDYTLENKCRKTDSFLRWKDLSASSGEEVGWHLGQVSALDSLARVNRAEVRFFLPLTFKTDAERAFSISLFQALPDSLKVAYTEAFLESAANPDLLFDANHLNHQGARVWSNFFCDYISNKPTD